MEWQVEKMIFNNKAPFEVVVYFESILCLKQGFYLVLIKNRIMLGLSWWSSG